MKRGFSCYLDLVRVLACLTVFAHHLILNYGCYESTGTACKLVSRLVPFRAGHAAVVIFFVLSGYVITYVASERETTFRQYALSRCARIYSVAIPTLFLTALFAIYFMSVHDYSNIPVYQFRKLWKYLPMFLTFTTDHWFYGEDPFSHGGWWSLSYEVWYYVIFAAAFYARGWRRWVLTTLALICVGPKLWALFPCWLAGGIVYRLQQQAKIQPPAAIAVVAGSLFATLFTIESNGLVEIDDWTDGLSGGWLSNHMRFSQWFVGDILLSILFATNIFAAKFARMDFGIFVQPVKYLASLTFTFYMIHGLIILICIRRLGFGVAPTILAVLTGTYLIALVTEHQKDRLQRFLSAALTAIYQWPRRRVAAPSRG